MIEVSVPASSSRRPRPGIRVHCRGAFLESDLTDEQNIPVTTVVCTLVDEATRLPPAEIEAAIIEADKLRLITPPALRSALDGLNGRRGVPAVRKIIDRRTFRLTRSQLERYFLPLARKAGLSLAETRAWVNGFEVDFYWPELGLVVETDGLTYHRTPAQQATDRRRDQAHTAAGMTPLRFTHGQVRYEPDYVVKVLTDVARRLRPA